MVLTLPLPPPGQALKWLGGPLDVRVEIASSFSDPDAALWDEALWDESNWTSADPDWIDVSEFVFSVEISAGTARWGERFESASCTVVVDNTTGRFTPGSGNNPWFIPLRPGRKMRVVVIPDSDPTTRNPIFTGLIDGMYDSYDDAAHAITTAFVCSDFMGVMAAHIPPEYLTAPTGVQSTDERVHAALDLMGWPAEDRDIQTGEHSMASSHLAESTLEECQKAADAEGGIFYTNRAGMAVFKSRDWLVTDDRSVNVQGWLGYLDVPTEASTDVWDVAQWDTAHWTGFEENALHVIGVESSWEAARVYNDVGMARNGGVLQLASDPDSQELHRVRSFRNTSLENALDSEVLILAERFLTAFKDSRMRIDSVAVAAVEGVGAEDRNRMLWDTRFGDRIAIRIQTAWGWKIDFETHVMGLNHRITGDDWNTTFLLDDAQTYEPEGGP